MKIFYLLEFGAGWVLLILYFYIFQTSSNFFDGLWCHGEAHLSFNSSTLLGRLSLYKISFKFPQNKNPKLLDRDSWQGTILNHFLQSTDLTINQLLKMIVSKYVCLLMLL